MKSISQALNDLALSLPPNSLVKVVLSKEAFESFQDEYKIKHIPQAKLTELVTENGSIAIES